MSGYSISVLRNPKNKTEFKRGQIVGFHATDDGFIVVGEDDTHLHLFSLANGGYMGVFKAEPNLACLTLRRESLGDAVINLTESACT